jgi:hypothetical protein
MTTLTQPIQEDPVAKVFKITYLPSGNIKLAGGPDQPRLIVGEGDDAEVLDPNGILIEVIEE